MQDRFEQFPRGTDMLYVAWSECSVLILGLLESDDAPAARMLLQQFASENWPRRIRREAFGLLSIDLEKVGDISDALSAAFEYAALSDPDTWGRGVAESAVADLAFKAGDIPLSVCWNLRAIRSQMHDPGSTSPHLVRDLLTRINRPLSSEEVELCAGLLSATATRLQIRSWVFDPNAPMESQVESLLLECQRWGQDAPGI